MVAARGKKKTANSNKNLEENKAAENGLAEKQFSGLLTVDVVEPNEDAQLEDQVYLITDKARNENSGEMSGEEGEKETEEDGEDPSIPETETNGDNKAELEENTFEDDEIDDQEDMLWEDEEEHFEHDNEEIVLDGFDVSEEEATEDDDEVSEEEATEEDEVSEEETTKKENDEDNNQEEKRNAKQDTREAKAKEDGREAKEHYIEKLEANLNNINKSNERSRKKKVVKAGRLKKVDSEDKPESSRKRKVKKRVDTMGMIFMCSSETKKDCYQYRVLGLPGSKKDIVEKIYTGMRLFLYDVDLKLMYGIYKAAGPGGYNIEPKAFKSQFPSQVRFKVMENFSPLAEEKFKIVIKENYFTKTKFDCLLNSEQVKKLCRLFATSSKGRPSKNFGRGLKAEKHLIRRERNRKQRTGDKRRLPLREEVKCDERPRKRPRKVMSPAPPPRPRHPAPPPRPRHPAPLPSTVPSSYLYNRASDVDAYRRDPYLERHSPYRDRRDQPLILLDPYGGARDPPIERNERYRDRRDPHLERRYAHRGSRDSHIDRHDSYVDDVESYSRRRDPYRDEQVPYLEPHDRYRDRQDPYIERRDSYRDGRDPYIERRDSYRDRRASYLDRRVPFGDSAHSELYNSYRRDPLLGSSNVYREVRGVEFRDSYRRDELLGRRDLHPIDSETRNHHDIAGRDAYGSNRERPSYEEPLYPAAYPSRAGAYRL
ncbi:hypothetical protein C2S53_014143 [Perilla frutescens var. hirtella]|uniref:DCD domain-containing protein n=1 Tax=Perilla frutescens var. hirtella TaxID=608512 RepID=A0AAD4J779_PERFH|nr:hypothetical protein C2S53_014143 [Perilla frutescens var. hirtella]